MVHGAWNFHCAREKKLAVAANAFFDTIIDRKNVPPSNHLDIGALGLPTLARNQTGDWLMPSHGRQPQHTDVQVVAQGGRFLSMIVQIILAAISKFLWAIAKSLAAIAKFLAVIANVRYSC